MHRMASAILSQISNANYLTSRVMSSGPFSHDAAQVVTLVFVYMVMHCGCMPWCLLNIKALGCGTELLLGVFRGQNSKKSSYFFPILG